MNTPKTAKKSNSTVGETVEDVIQKIKIEKDIRLVSVDKIAVYDRNAKKHTPWQVGAVAKAIQTFGFNVPLILDGKNVIIAGHCRLESAKSLGMDMVPCIIKTDLTVDQVQAYRLLDNKLNESMWDRALAMEDVWARWARGCRAFENRAMTMRRSASCRATSTARVLLTTMRCRRFRRKRSPPSVICMCSATTGCFAVTP